MTDEIKLAGGLKPFLKPYMEDMVKRSCDFWCYHVCTSSTFLAMAGTIGHICYPQHRDVIDASIASILGFKKG